MMKMFLLQIANILVVLAIIAIPAVAVFFAIKFLKEKNFENENLIARITELEKKVAEIEEYINESYR